MESDGDRRPTTGNNYYCFKKTTMATTTTARVVPAEECRRRSLSRIHAVRSRPTSIAAQEFFSGVDAKNWRSLPQRLERLCQVLEGWSAESGSPELLCSFSDDPKESRRVAMTAAVMAHADSSFLGSFQKLFQNFLLERQSQFEEMGQVEASDDELSVYSNLRELGWIRTDGMLQKPLGQAVHHTILNWVRNTIAKEFEQEKLYPQVQEYQSTIVTPWLRDLVGPIALEADHWDNRLDFCTAECYCLVRMDEIFDLVAEYPDSHAAVVELRTVLERTKMHHALGRALRQALVRRLNHPGATTSQIIDVYINTIKVLREIDPSDRLLQLVAEPVRSYLRGRNDTVRCIITSLTDAEVGGDLYEELRRQDARPLENTNTDSDDEEEPPDFDWQPPPPISRSKSTFFGLGTKGGGGDILSMLVSIYGSKELFVNEYRLMLADKLLANLDYNTDKEVHTLELLKLRFGEMSMRNCEIMIKDTDDSKRIVSNVHGTIKSKQRTTKDPVVDAAIISHIFWPTLQKETLKHHPRIQAELDQFSTEYGRLKNPRRLVWMNQLGTVKLELDVVEENPDGTAAIETREFTCGPLLATLISHFADKDRWTAEDLSNETGIPEDVIQKRMAYWVNNRVIKLVPGANHEYEVATREHLLEGEHDAAVSMMDEDEGQAASAMAQEEEEMEVYESYICGMLTNMGQLPLERIHNMLKMFVTGSEVKYTKTPAQLSMFLQHLCKLEKLECGADGVYKLFKK